jgi:hypothetical protein
VRVNVRTSHSIGHRRAHFIGQFVGVEIGEI